MPGEDTNEMMKVRAVQGELTDLPADNPRASLSSRIRALLLRMSGIPQLIHEYGTLALNKALTLASGENKCSCLFSDGTYLYAGIYTTPAKIVKIDLSDYTKVSTLTFDTGEDYCSSLTSDGTYLYVGLLCTPGKIVKIDLSDFTKVSTLSTGIGAAAGCSCLLSDGTYLYAGIGDFPSQIVKVDLSDFTIVSTLTLGPLDNICYSLISDGTYLYAGLNDSPAKVVKIDLSSFTKVSTLTIEPAISRTRPLISDGTYLYAGLYTAPAKIVKIDLSDFTKVSTLTFDAGEDSCGALISDGTFLYAGLDTAPAKIVKIDLSNFTKVSTDTFALGENTPSSLFTDGSYIYIGLRISPAKIIRRYIIPTGASLRERKIDRIHERNVEQSMPTSFYGKVTTYTDTTHFAISTLSRRGNDFFKNWYVYVVRDSAGAGAAPQGEDAKKITDYVSSTGTFTHLPFTSPLAVGDEVLILQENLALAGAGGGAYSGDIEIWDSFEYASDASLQAKWPKSGGAASPTRSTTAFYQRYSMSIAISGAGVGEVHRAFSTPRDIGTLHNISITARSNKVGGDTFRFTLYDTAGNYSYWTQTIAAQDTWETFNIDPHSTPTADGGTPVDLDDVVELRLANLTNASTYLFDLIRFESLVSSKIGIGYDGLDDAVETTSSVRGHLLLTDELLSRTGTIYFVGIGGNDANDGKSWTNRRLTIASGYGLCSAGDTLIIGDGTFTEDINFNTDGVWIVGRQAGAIGTTSGTMISGASTMTCESNRFENIFFYDNIGTVVKVGNDANARYNEFWNCRIGGAGSAIPVHIDGTAGGSFNIFDKCNIYEGSTAAVLIDGGAATGNIFRNCRIRPQTGVASHAIHVNHASALRNTFIDCVVVGAGSTGTGIYFQAGAHNAAHNCHVCDITTPYNIAATNYIVGCHENSLITTSNTIQDDLTEINDRHILYDTVLYVDANSAVGSDANNGSKSSPYLTIAAAVAAASEYTTIMCSDSRTGAAAVGFDEDAAITGVTIDKNNITIIGGYPCGNGGHKVHIGNTIANADNVLNITGNHVTLIGLAIYLQDINGDEVTVLATGNAFRMEYCDLPAEIPANDQNECIRITGNHFVLKRVHTVNSDVGLRCTDTVEIGRVRNCTFQGATDDGILLETGTVDIYIESCQFQSCGDAIDIDAGATYNAFYECNFANNTNIWVNGGGITNQLINAKEESEITAGNTSEDDLKAIYDKIVGAPTSGVIDNLNVNAEVDLITEVTQTTVAEIDAIYVDYTGWLADGAIVAGTTLTIRVYLDDDAGALQEVGNLRDVITDGLSAGTMVKIEGLGSFERNFKVTVQSSVAPNGGVGTDLVKYHYVKYDRE